MPSFNGDYIFRQSKYGIALADHGIRKVTGNQLVNLTPFNLWYPIRIDEGLSEPDFKYAYGPYLKEKLAVDAGSLNRNVHTIVQSINSQQIRGAKFLFTVVGGGKRILIVKITGIGIITLNCYQPNLTPYRNADGSIPSSVIGSQGYG